MIDLNEAHHAVIAEVLNKNLAPNVKVFAFGSRVKGEARKHSDLDLIIKAKSEIDVTIKNQISESLAESDIPILVDIIDWNSISNSFKQCIKNDLIEFER